MEKSGHGLHQANISTNRLDSQAVDSPKTKHIPAMLVELYIEALLVDEELADMVWELSEAELITDEMAALAWWQLSYNSDSGRPRWDC